jgi:cap2 methyltransferase
MATEHDSWKEVENNPHCLEIIQNHPHMTYEIDPPFHRILRADAREMPYRKTDREVKTRIHWGQRKLLMSEIEFLTLLRKAGLRRSLVVYAGAAPGSHIPFLCRLFPDVHFLLVDPADFNVRESSRVSIIQDLFTDELAEQIAREHADKAIYFVSDIRTADPDANTEDEVERRVRWDQASQMRWHDLLNSRRSMLKFRLPWDLSKPGVPDVEYEEETEYLDGDIYLPVWGPQKTTECRLITHAGRPGARTMYNNKKYESQLMYFNNVTRHSLYSHDVTGQGLDHCYDCMAEIHILQEYLLEFSHLGLDEMAGEISRMSRDISRMIPGGRTLLSPNPDPATRKANIKRRQYRDNRPAHEQAAEDHRRRAAERRARDETRPWQTVPARRATGSDWQQIQPYDLRIDLECSICKRCRQGL